MPLLLYYPFAAKIRVETYPSVLEKSLTSLSQKEGI
jgi:hypothetical protein